MKRLSELSRDELLALSDSETQTLIDLELAHAGVIPEESPKEPELTVPDIKPTIEAFEVRGLVFLNKEDAMVAGKLPAMRENYDYNIGSEYKTLQPMQDSYDDKGIRPRMYFDKSALNAVKSQLQDIKRARNEYDSQLARYTKFVESTKSIRDSVYNAVRDARNEKREFEAAQTLFRKHLALAENNRQIAENFFRLAYKAFSEEYIVSVLNSVQ
jgi:hypothetical protein